MPLRINAKWPRLHKAALLLFALCCMLILWRASTGDQGHYYQPSGMVVVRLIQLIIAVPAFLTLGLPFQIAVLIIFSMIYGYKIYVVSDSPGRAGIGDYISPFYGRYFDHDMFWDDVALWSIILLLLCDFIARLAAKLAQMIGHKINPKL
ncbi:MAG: hypothetical protein J0I16_03810 [Rhizobiales bacterium]|nr:hypothetical protein [Hyphomicrobiales bacterium]